MLKINEQGVLSRTPTPSLIEMDIRIDDCRRRRKAAILKARKECGE